MDLLSENDMQKYRLQKKTVGPAYAPEFVKELEPLIDTILKRNVLTMMEMVEKNGLLAEEQGVNIDTFFNFFTSDCIQTATVGHSKHLLAEGRDDGSVASVHNAWKYIHLAGYFPNLHRSYLWVFNNFVKYVRWNRKSYKGITHRYTEGAPAERQRNSTFEWVASELSKLFEQHKIPASSTSHSSPHGPTIADKLFFIRSQKPEMRDQWLINICMTNFGAGIETIAITISTFINFVLSDPECQSRIQAEIDSARQAGKIADSIPQYREVKEHLPYLNACLSEAMRLHPAVGAPFARTVPKSGLEVDGYYLPPGTTVGVNPWVLGRSKELYGEDAGIWRPERWLEYSEDKIRALDKYSMNFGTDARACLGKHLATHIFTKIIPLMFTYFDWSYVEPEKKREIECTFSVRLHNVKMKWNKRKDANFEALKV